MEKVRAGLVEEENRRIRRFRFLVDLTSAVLHQDATLSLVEARRMVVDLRSVAGELFPGKEGTFDLVIWPRLDRVVKERFGVGLDERVH